MNDNYVALPIYFIERSTGYRMNFLVPKQVATKFNKDKNRTNEQTAEAAERIRKKYDFTGLNQEIKLSHDKVQGIVTMEKLFDPPDNEQIKRNFYETGELLSVGFFNEATQNAYYFSVEEEDCIRAHIEGLNADKKLPGEASRLDLKMGPNNVIFLDDARKGTVFVDEDIEKALQQNIAEIVAQPAETRDQKNDLAAIVTHIEEMFAILEQGPDRQHVTCLAPV